MDTLRLFRLAIRYNWDSLKSNPANLVAGTIGMIINNVIILWGLWAMLFHGKPEGNQMTIYFLSLNAMITIAWGSVCFFLGGLRSIGQYIEDGTLEPMLATPRDPLLLAGVSQSQAPALGDLLQGALSLLALFWLAPIGMALRCTFFSIISATAFAGLFILTGSLCFFVRRGSTLGMLLLECNLSLSFYPSGKLFSGQGRMFLYLTPAAASGILPMDAIESGTLFDGANAGIAAMVFLWFSIQVFRYGLRRYQSSNYVMARG